MLAARLLHPVSLAVPGAAGALAAAVLGAFPTPVGIVVLAGILVVFALVVWPWAAVPTAVVGGALAAQALGLQRVAPVVAVHAGLVAAGLLAIALRRALDPAWGGRVVTPADRPMVAFAVVIALGSAYGLAVGNPEDRVLVAAYQLAVVPVYFFLATLTLSTPRRLQAASVVFLVGAAAMALAGMGVEGRHGGLFSALALPGTLAAAAVATRTGVRLVLMGAGALFAIDVVLSAYRAVWLASGVALVLVFVTGTPRLRRAAVAVLAVAVVIALALGMARTEAVEARADLVGSALHQSAGYRLDEARVGWETFLVNPLVGQGLGQVEPDTFVPGFGVTDAGPVYHVFYLVLLANAGLLGLAAFLWPLARALRHSRSCDGGQAAAFGALLVGFAAAAFFAGPTDGHWELGLLAAASLLAARFERLRLPR